MIKDNHQDMRARQREVRRILLVEDRQDVCEMLKMLLETNGHEVRVAHNGTSAIAAARDYRPDVVLLDISLPDMSGHEVARQLRQIPEVSDAVLIALSGLGDDADRLRSLEAGFDHFVQKPASLNELEKLFRTTRRKHNKPPT